MSSGTPYERRQRSPLILVALGTLLLAAAFLLREEVEPGLILLTVVTLLLANFGSLTVRVDEGAVKLRFGVGLIRRTIPLDRIQAAARVRNRWWYGWGIRLTPHGWLWNVAGLDAVELRLQDGKVFRIGTDDPAGLAAAVEAHLGQEIAEPPRGAGVPARDPEQM